MLRASADPPRRPAPQGKRLLNPGARRSDLDPAWYPSRMFDIGLQEMLLIGVIALLVFGPAKLPELGRMVGRAMREFRRASDEFRSTVETNLHINDLDPVAEPSIAPPADVVPTPEPVVTLPSEQETTPAEATTVAVVEEHGEPFCAQRGSRLFHRRDCAWVPRIPEADRAYFKRAVEAREQGHVACPACDPWEPAEPISPQG